jgi:hypothetical protein
MRKKACSDTLPRFRATPCFLGRDILPSSGRDTLPSRVGDILPRTVSPPDCLPAHEKPKGGKHR